MFVERDFLVKQAQINDQIRQRELERLLPSPARHGVRLQMVRRASQRLRQLLPVGGRGYLIGANEPC